MGSELYGMEFGSYNAKIEEFKVKYNAKPNNSSKKDEYESAYTFFGKGQSRVKGNAFREKIKTDHYGNNKFSCAIIFEGNLMYCTISKEESGLNKFDYIQGESEYAIDFNGNNKVDKDEVFSGTMDRFSYEQAKSDGDLRKYTEYQKQYHYDWVD